MRTSLLLAVLFSLAMWSDPMITGACAESTVLEGEYVISSVPRVPSIREKALDTLQELTDERLEIADEEGSLLLVADATKEEINQTGAENEEALDDSTLCKDLRRYLRAQRIERRRSGANTIIRSMFCEPNGVFRTTAIPNDALFSTLWGMHQANNVDINAPEAWNGGADCSSQVVAVIDTGVMYDHADLATNMWRNPNETINGIDDDGNGVVDDVHGFNAVRSSGDPLDDNGHGTHCAGTIGARGGNGIGVAGVCHSIQIMAVKFLDSSGSGSLWNAVRAINYVTAMKRRGVNVVLSSNSWGGGGYYSTMLSAIQDAQNEGLLFVAAAGNEYNNNDARPSYPASYNLDSIISVAAIDRYGVKADFSNYGATSVDIAAPGVSIASTWVGGGYSTISGTSMAAPHVSGVLAFLKARAPYLTRQQLKTALMRGDMVKPLSALQGQMIVPGIPDLAALVSDPSKFIPAPLTPVPTATPSPTRTPAPTATATPLPTVTPTPTPAWYNISGSVTDSSGNLLGGATVTLRLADGTTRSATTGPSGEYVFLSILSPVRYSLTVTKGGYQFNPVQDAYLDRNTTNNFQALPSEIQISARVIRGTNGAPIQGARVTNGSSTATADSQGLVTFSVPFGASYSMKLELPSDATYIVQDTLSGEAEGALRRTFVVF
jgi:subtilisin family serine protease